MADPDFNYVTLLLHCDGADGSTTITDSSGYVRSVTANGSAAISTAQSKWGGASVALSGSGAFLSSTISSAIGVSDLTVEAWIYVTSFATDGEIFTIGDISNTAQFDFVFEYKTSGALRGSIQNGGGTTQVDLVTADSLISSDTWTHVAMTAAGNTAKLWINGVERQSGAISGTRVQNRTDCRIGRLASSPYERYFSGYIDDLRVTNGVARYTADFSLPTEAFPGPAGGVADITLPQFAVSAGDVSGSATPNLPGITITAYSGASVGGELPRLTATVAGGGYASLDLPRFTVSARRGVACPDISLPLLTAVTYSGGVTTASLPTLAATSSAHDATGERDAKITLPKLEVYALTGVHSQPKLPALAAAATGTVPLVVTFDTTLPAPTVTAVGRTSAVARAEPLLPALTASAHSGAICSVTIGGITMVASGTAGTVGSVQATLPLFVAVADATVVKTASVDITLPALSMATGVRAPILLPSLNLVAIGTAVVAVTYEAYALNLKHSSDKAHDELTRYTNFPFDRIVRYKDSYYGMNATGLYLLEGTTDDGDPIPWEVATHITDFDSPKLKTVERAYFGGRLGPDATVALSVGEKADNSYSYTTPRGQTVQNYRQVFGKGAKARYFSLGVSGEDEIELDSLELAVTELARRI